MDGSGQRENGRHKQDMYNRGTHNPWSLPPYLMKDHHALSIKFMTLLNERDTAFQERDLALAEKKAALAERDMAILQRDTALSERDNAQLERDNAIAAFEYQENITMNGSSGACPPGCGAPRGMKHVHRLSHVHHSSHIAEPAYNTREMHVSDAYPISVASSEPVKPRRGKRTKDTKAMSCNKSPSKRSRKSKKGSGHEWGSDEDLNKQMTGIKSEWKDQDLGLNQVNFDDSTMPVPVCSCTGMLQPCYKWGQGGWQSACCTTTMSMYPLPVMPNKRHARIGGRKMSGGVFTKLLSRLASEGHDLSTPLDLKDHWSKHGTNRYITIK
ncbi:GAGA-binding transcriptional activator [Macleaya cordata]|uniref:GAGA-binding transcriptional activator n=1 Tax=Macleaya cordata TaxID=56857 RepID=A0A200QQX0_MACCD|nr:GAGA-binding transcriptional activator [Macleaya cordata]